MRHSQKLNPDATGRATPTLVRLPDDMRCKLTAVAEQRGVGMGWVIRDAVTAYLDEIDGEQPSAPPRAS